MGINIYSVVYCSGVLLIIITWLATSPHSLDKFFLMLLRSKLIYLLPLTFCIFIMQILEPSPLQWPASEYDTGLQIAGFILYIIGFLLVIWTKTIMKKSWERPILQNPTKQRQLIAHGPFAYTRNPMYVGFILMFTGFEISLRSWFLLLIIPILVLTHLVVSKEEKLMSVIFGTEYHEYKKKVRRYF